jgi:hypothetical protein
VFDAGDRRRGIFKRGSFTARDFDFERASHQLLAQLGFDSIPGSRPFWTLEAKRFPKAAARLIEEGFIVLAEGRRVRTPRASRLTLASGIDWLDLEGEIDFEGEVVSVPQILESLARGDRFITLGDGSQGMLPEEWLERAGVLQALSPERREKALRFRPFHALLLDALLESENPPPHQRTGPARASREERADDPLSASASSTKSSGGTTSARSPSASRARDCPAPRCG